MYLSIVFPSFLINTLFTSVTPCFFSSLFISSMLHKESPLLLITPLLTFRDLWGYVLTLIVKLSFLVENQRVYSFSTSTRRVWFFHFFTVIRVRFVDITFSIISSDKLVIGALLDSMIMNQGKGASVSLSEEPDSLKLRLNFVRERSHICYIFFTGPMLHHPPCSPTWEGNKPREQPIHLDWDGDTIPVYSCKEYDSEPLPNSAFNYTAI